MTVGVEVKNRGRRRKWVWEEGKGEVCVEEGWGGLGVRAVVCKVMNVISCERTR